MLWWTFNILILIPIFLPSLTLITNKKMSNFDDKPLPRCISMRSLQILCRFQKSATLHFALLKKWLPVFGVWRLFRCANSIMTSNLSDWGSIVLRNIHPHNIITRGVCSNKHCNSVQHRTSGQVLALTSIHHP